jgi:hypothetical protein
LRTSASVVFILDISFTQVNFFSNFKVSNRKHVQDGICLPTVAISSLSNKVTRAL